MMDKSKAFTLTQVVQPEKGCCSAESYGDQPDYENRRSEVDSTGSYNPCLDDYGVYADYGEKGECSDISLRSDMGSDREQDTPMEVEEDSHRDLPSHSDAKGPENDALPTPKAPPWARHPTAHASTTKSREGLQPNRQAELTCRKEANTLDKVVDHNILFDCLLEKHLSLHHKLTGAGLHTRAWQVLDVDRVYNMVTETLTCTECSSTYVSWSQTVLQQLDLTHRSEFRVILTQKYACDIGVVWLLREQGLGDNPTRVLKQLRDNHTEEWLHRVTRFTTQCVDFLHHPSLLPTVFPEPPEPAVVPSFKWLQVVYSQDILTRLDEIKAKITSTYGAILKLESTKKVAKKLDGMVSGMALWLTSGQRAGSGTCTNSFNFQIYLLEGLHRWNQDRAAVSLSSGPLALHSYSDNMVHYVNQNYEKLFGRKLVPKFCSPACYTGEFLGVQYLFQQTGQALQDMNPDSEETAKLIEEFDLEEERAEEEGFCDVQDPTVMNMEVL
ncbi:hypothetical protein P4O66_004171 [Electrophorus voltai]|uniref:DUF6729 domain-containing protein n=1 Tax=Electrophorus voltai TaxID=2609070 RepID=A0AAD8ZP31_9TELE|nr:hypothetical protein P4O66_004171 [Electrophorus voltai]